MRHQEKLLQQLGIVRPIIQAPMAGSDGVELVAEVSNNGALGSLGAGYLTPDEIAQSIAAIKNRTNKPFAINLFVPNAAHASDMQINIARSYVQAACHNLQYELPTIKAPYIPDFNEQLDVLIAEKISILSFTFGIPDDDILKRCKQHRMILMGTATTVEEAKALADKGVDIIVAQGSEAGGHRGSFLKPALDSLVGLQALLPAVVDAVNLPIIAAGGIMDGRGIAAALVQGAAAVQMGTAFLSCPEAIALNAYKKLLLEQMADDTTLTRAFTGRLARGIKNLFITEMIDNEDAILDYPIQHALTKAMRQEAKRQVNLDFMSLWAGQGASLSRGLPVNKLLQVLDQEVQQCLQVAWMPAKNMLA